METSSPSESDSSDQSQNEYQQKLQRLAKLRAQRKELQAEQESLKCMISDLNDVWLQIIIDNGEDATKTLAAEFETLSEKVDSLKRAIEVRNMQGMRMDAIATFWSLFVEEEPVSRANKRCVVDMHKSKSALPLLQGLSSGPTKSSQSTGTSG